MNTTTTQTDFARARDICDRRLAALRANGEEERNTIAWRDAIYESALVGFYARTR